MTITVTTTADNTTNDGFCSLREALSYTNGSPVNTNCGPNTGTPYTINLPAAIYSLTNGELQIGANGNVNVTITGVGAASTTIRQSAATCTLGTARVFNLDPNAYVGSPGGVVVTISGVTISNGTAQAYGGGPGGWDVTWLNRQVGWLEGTAYPTWEGNTVLTAHGYTADGEAGPFALLKNLSYGETIIIHLGGMKYTYAVRTNLLVNPSDTRWLTKHETLDWVTLITCQQYDAKTKSYRYRRVVRAVLVRVEPE